jgi:hypothetical protein
MDLFYQTFMLMSSFYGQVRRREWMGGTEGNIQGRGESFHLGTQKWKCTGRGAGMTERNREDEI